MTRLHAWRSHRQGLDGSLAGHTASQVLARTGWARSIGGAAPYLTLFARAGLRRAEVDGALENLEIHELPSARGCTYVIPAPDFPLALAAGQPFAEDELKVARRLGVMDTEIENLCAAVRKALGAGPLDPDALKKKLPSDRRERRKGSRPHFRWRWEFCSRPGISGGCRSTAALMGNATNMLGGSVRRREASPIWRDAGFPGSDLRRWENFRRLQGLASRLRGPRSSRSNWWRRALVFFCCRRIMKHL